MLIVLTWELCFPTMAYAPPRAHRILITMARLMRLIWEACSTILDHVHSIQLPRPQLIPSRLPTHCASVQRRKCWRLQYCLQIKVLFSACDAVGVIMNCGTCRQEIARNAARHGALKTFTFAANLCSFFVRIATARIRANTLRRWLCRTRSHAPAVKAQLN